MTRRCGLARSVPAAALLSCALLLLSCARTPQLDLGTVPAGVRVVSQVREYPINTLTMTEIHREMARLGPTAQGRRWAGATSWNISWRYAYETRAIAGCALAKPRMVVTVNMVMPRWEPEGAPNDETREWWQRFSAGLMEHEVGHARIAIQGAREIMRSIDGLSAASCDIVVTRANTIAQRLLAETNRRQQEYDRDTQHGATQILARINPAP